MTASETPIPLTDEQAIEVLVRLGCPRDHAQHLDRLDPYADTCLFVVVPDHPGDGPLTFQRFVDHAHYRKGSGWKAHGFIRGM